MNLGNFIQYATTTPIMIKNISIDPHNFTPVFLQFILYPNLISLEPLVYFLSLQFRLFKNSVSKWTYTAFILSFQSSFICYNVWKTLKMLLVCHQFVTFSLLSNIPLYGYALIHLSIHKFNTFIYSQVDGHSNFLDIMSKAAMTIWVQFFVWLMHFYILGHILSVYLKFVRIKHLKQKNY